MNVARRKELDRAATLLADAREIIEVVACAEEEAFGNLPESLQDGERGQKMTDCASELGDIAADIETLVERLSEASA